MSLCTFAENYLMLGVTPVENLFIQEYLPRAPGDYVRVYLYGLMQCYHPSEDMTVERTAHILDLPEKTVIGALQYWERQGLMRRISDNPISYQYLNIAATLSDESPMDKAIYQHRDFNNRLQQIFGSRLLHPSEYSIACEWMEELKMPENIVLMLVENYVAQHGIKCRFKRLNQQMTQWAEEGILTEEQAYEHIMQNSEAWKLCERVLKRFSLRRKPTKDEVLLARKWLEEWKLSPEAVLAACSETVNGRTPSMGYLDGILKRNTNALSGAEMTQQLQDQRRIDDAIKALHEALGMRNIAPMTSEQINYRNYLEAGFKSETILLVAQELSMTKKIVNMETLHRQLTSFIERNLISFNDVQEYLSRWRTLRDQAAQVFSACGMSRDVNNADAALMDEWLGKADLPLILFAAECARGKALPTAYITKLLDNWLKENITTVEMARQQHEQSRPASDGRSNAQTPTFLNYEQRNYQDSDFDYLFEKMEQYDNKDDES